MPPEHWLIPGVVPGYRQVSDRTALCPVLTRDGYRPAEPTEQPDTTAVEGAEIEHGVGA